MKIRLKRAKFIVARLSADGMKIAMFEDTCSNITQIFQASGKG
jgi:hypothetical protein